MKKQLKIFFVLLFFSQYAFGQIVQPGSLELVVYPGSEINSNDFKAEATPALVNKLNIFDDSQTGLICFNKKICYDDLNFNVDLLNEVVQINRVKDTVFIRFPFIFSIVDSTDNATYVYESELEDTPNFFGRLFYDQDNVRLYKRYSVKKLQADYRPEFDTGSKTPTYQIEEDYIFVDENKQTTSFNKIKSRVILRNLPTNKLSEYLSDNSYKVKTAKDLLNLIEIAYSSN